MNVGVSTASLYPLHIEDAFAQLAGLGVKTVEVFANSFREAEEPYISMLLEMMERDGIFVPSFHPFTSVMETGFLFSTYDRRVEEMMEFYRGFFRSMNRLGADIFVLHGAFSDKNVEPGYYLRQFRMLSEAGSEYGITVAQENVCYCMSGRLEFLKMMKRELGERAKFVLDLKQARRSQESVWDYIEALGSDIIHCHVSDGGSGGDCLPVGKGEFDFARLVKTLEQQGYSGAYIVELYRHNYGGFEELRQSADALSEIIDKTL